MVGDIGLDLISGWLMDMHFYYFPLSLCHTGQRQRQLTRHRLYTAVARAQIGMATLQEDAVSSPIKNSVTRSIHLPDSYDATSPPSPLPLPLLPSPFLTGVHGYHPLNNFGIKDACR